MYDAIMPKKKTLQILCVSCDKKFAHLREIWDHFTKNCSDMYRPSINCTVEEQPDKYGLKLVLYDYNRYVILEMAYVGKTTPNGSTSLAQYFEEKLGLFIAQISTATYDICKITTVGILRKNTVEIPSDTLIKIDSWAVQSSAKPEVIEY